MVGIRRLLAIILILLASSVGLSVRTICYLSLFVLVIVFVVIPLFFHYNAYIQRQMIFLTWVKWPKLVDFNKPENEGLNGTINFYLNSDKNVQIGVWQVLPNNLLDESVGKDREWYTKSLSNGQPIVIYMHGNTASRSRDHRVYMYQVLRNLNFHVIAFDYRGYADSSQTTPTKKGVVTDGHVVYKYVKSKANGSPVIIWGHSLGTGVSSQVVSDLCDEGNPPHGLVLESPFNNIRDEIKHHPMTFLWRKMPFFEWLFTGSLNKSDVAFLTDQVIQNIHIPILIFHAEDDHVIPFILGKKLYETAKESRVKGKSKPVLFVPFENSQGFAHVSIHLSKELPKIVKAFVEKCIQDNWMISDYEGHLQL